MTDAYVHVKVEPGSVDHAARELTEQTGVEACHLVTGDHDLVVRLSLDTKDDIPRVVTRSIHSVPGVVDTETHVAFDLEGNR